MLSSVSPYLLLTPFVVSFISIIVFFSSDWFFFEFSSSLLKSLLCSFILFPGSASILIEFVKKFVQVIP